MTFQYVTKQTLQDNLKQSIIGLITILIINHQINNKYVLKIVSDSMEIKILSSLLRNGKYGKFSSNKT